jgi:hypothetical protein
MAGEVATCADVWEFSRPASPDDRPMTAFLGDIMKYVSVAVITSILLAGCASSYVRNWNPETKTGQIELFHGESMLDPPTVKDAHDELEESGRCPSGYDIKELGWRGGGWIKPAKDTEDKDSNSTSLNIGGKEVYSVERSRGSKSGKSTVVKVWGFQTQKKANNHYTVVRSPVKTESSGTMRGMWFDFKCK